MGELPIQGAALEMSPSRVFPPMNRWYFFCRPFGRRATSWTCGHIRTPPPLKRRAKIFGPFAALRDKA